MGAHCAIVRNALRCAQILPVLGALILFFSIEACGGFHPGIDASTSVPALPSEDLSGSCKYDIFFPAKTARQRGVFVVYERGDSSAIFNSLTVRGAMAQVGFAMVFAHECNASSYDDIQSDPAKGPGRALFEALDQFGSFTGHPELAEAGVLLYGFSAAGVLAAEMSSYAPQRTLGLVAYAAGSAHVDLQTFVPSAAALKVPSLFLDNARDDDSGTYRSYAYFTSGRSAGALWGFGVQNDVGHCCNATTIPVLLPWAEEVARPTAGSLSGSAGGAQIASFLCTPNDVTDAQNDQNCSVTSASLGAAPAPGEMTAWLPGSAAATAWLAWVTNPSAN